MALCGVDIFIQKIRVTVAISNESLPPLIARFIAEMTEVSQAAKLLKAARVPVPKKYGNQLKGVLI